MASGDARIHLVTTKTALDEAQTWMDSFTLKMMETDNTKEYWQQQTGFDGPPHRYDRPTTSEAHIAYANFLDQTFLPMVGSDAESTAPKSAPKSRSYSRVVHDGQSSVHSRTQVTEVSTLSSEISDSAMVRTTVDNAIKSMQEKASEETTNMKLDLLEEMRQLNKKADDRMDRLEESTISFEHMLRELHTNNTKKDEELEKQERKMEMISRTTKSTATKVDKLNNAVKSFVQVMAAVVGAMTSSQHGESGQQALMDISQMLDDEQDSQEDMDLEESSNKKRKEPSPGAQDALGGEGSKK